MVERITVILFILLFFMAGGVVVIPPWVKIGGGGGWGGNYLLGGGFGKTGLPIIRQAVASGWMRGAITGLGVLNLFLAFWEIAHFKKSVEMLSENELGQVKSEK
ncbi:MAG TPA: hypothetical protein PKE69_13405 [Pyrinomonadaceae bacterium]|nr:hypothetical protein [Pyrinomonadaceae bacterium]